MLYGVGNLCSGENENPAKIDPDQKEWQGGKGTIYGIVFRNSNLHGDIDILDLKPEKTSKNCTDHGRNGFNLGVWEEEVYYVERQSQKKDGWNID